MRDVTPDTIEQHRAALAARLATGVPLPPAPDGPLVAHFHALELSSALEHVATKAQNANMSKVRIDMTIDNALDLAAYLRRAALAGV